MIPFQIAFAGPSALDGSVDADTGARSCELSLTATASGNFPLPRAYWTSARFEYVLLDSNESVGEVTWGSAQLRGFWGVTEIWDGDSFQSSSRAWGLRDLPEAEGLDPAAPFRIEMEFSYNFGNRYSFSGTRYFHMECR